MAYNITVKQGNLLQEENAIFIVNASNTNLILGSGVSMSFKRHCGFELEKEMQDKLLSLKSSLCKGDVIATTSAKATNFVYALHACVIDSKKRGDKRLPRLEDIDKILENIEIYLEWYIREVNDENLKLVLPLLGCGVGKLLKDDVVKIYKDFFNRKIYFKCEVVIYGFTNKDFESLKSLMVE